MLWGGRWEGGSCLGTHVRIKDFKIKKKEKKNPPGPLEDKLMGEGNYRALREQAQYSDQDLQQVHQVFL